MNMLRKTSIVAVMVGIAAGLVDYWFAARRLMPTFFELPVSFFLFYVVIALAVIVTLRKIGIRLRCRYGLWGVAFLLCVAVIVWITWLYERPEIHVREMVEKRPEMHFHSEEVQPDILFILVDALAPRFMGCYGNEKGLTPNMDALARDGVVFENAYASSNFTLSSCASLWTGLYPTAHGVHRAGDLLPDGIPTLPGVLKNEGYHTAVWSMNRFISEMSGFERNIADFYLLDLQCYWPVCEITPGTLLGKMMGLIGIPDFFSRCTVKVVTFERPHFQGEDRIMTEHFLKWLGRKRRPPAFCYIHYIAPHDPYWPPLEYRPAGAKPYGQLNPDKKENLARREELRALYEGELRYIDGLIGSVICRLKEAGGYEKTLIVLTADHGEEFGEHGHWAHGTSMYEEALHIPLIICWPEKVPGDRRVRALAQTVDFMPTIMDLVKAGIPGGVGGMSLLPTLEGRAIDPARVVFSERVRKRETVRAVFDHSYKYTRQESSGGTKETLIDRRNDPGEERDIVRAKPGVLGRYRDLARRLTNEAKQKAMEIGRENRPVDDYSRKKLRALGYIQ